MDLFWTMKSSPSDTNAHNLNSSFWASEFIDKEPYLQGMVCFWPKGFKTSTRLHFINRFILEALGLSSHQVLAKDMSHKTFWKRPKARYSTVMIVYQSRCLFSHPTWKVSIIQAHIYINKKKTLLKLQTAVRLRIGTPDPLWHEKVRIADSRPRAKWAGWCWLFKNESIAGPRSLVPSGALQLCCRGTVRGPRKH